MNPQEQRDWIFQRLKHSLQALALPAEQQVQLFPKAVVIPDELVLDFDHWQSCAVDNYRIELTEEQLHSLEILNNKIESATDDADKCVWREDALRSHTFWTELRQLAIRALESFGWPLVAPPDYKHEYVLGGNAGKL